MADEHEEGWYTDPFQRHEARWMSAGTPTKLVRDGDEESYDDPPTRKPLARPVPIEADEIRDGRDLLHAGEGGGEVGSLQQRLHEAGQFGATWGAHVPLPDMGRSSSPDPLSHLCGSGAGVQEEELVGRRRDGHVLVITLQRTEKRNAVNRTLADALDDALNELDDDRDLWAGVLTGDPNVFSAGSDLTAGGRDYQARPAAVDTESSGAVAASP